MTGGLYVTCTTMRYLPHIALKKAANGGIAAELALGRDGGFLDDTDLVKEKN